MAIIEIPLYLTYGPNESNGEAQVVTTPGNGASLTFKGDFRQDATIVFKGETDQIVDNGRYSRLKFSAVTSNIVGDYTPIHTHNGEEYERFNEDNVVIGPQNEYIVKASNVVEYTSRNGVGPNVQYENEEDQLLAIPFQQEHASQPLVSIRPAEVIASGSLLDLANITIEAIYNYEGYVYSIVEVGPGKFHVQVVYGKNTTYPSEEVLRDNTLFYELDEDQFVYAFATDVELTDADIELLENDPTRIEEVWGGTSTDPFSFTKDNMVSLVISTGEGGLKYLPFSAGVQLYRGIVSTANHLSLSQVEGAKIVYSIPEEYAVHDIIYIIYYDTEQQTWAQLARTGVTEAITEVEVVKDHQCFTILNRTLTRLEMDQLCQHANLLIKVFYDGFVLEEGFKRSNIVRLYPGTEGLLGGDTVTDIVVGDIATIEGYEPDIRTFLNGVTYGVQDFYVHKGITGVVNSTVFASEIRFDISYLNTRFLNMFRAYTIIDTIVESGTEKQRIRTFVDDPEAAVPVVDKLYINGVDTALSPDLVTPDLPVALDGAGYAITIGNPPTCKFEVLPTYITPEQVIEKYAEYTDNCVV